jgi:hypothetical protein
VFNWVLRRFAIDGMDCEVLAALTGPGLGGALGIDGAEPVGGLGAVMIGGFGTELREDSGSDV